MKKLIAFTAAAIMCLSLAACGSSSDDSGLSTVESGKLHMATNAAFLLMK